MNASSLILEEFNSLFYNFIVEFRHSAFCRVSFFISKYVCPCAYKRGADDLIRKKEAEIAEESKKPTVFLP